MIAIIDGIGNNYASIQYALQRLGFASVITCDKATIQQSQAVILPGVGHATTAMQNLASTDLVKLIKNLTQPVLGICLGMQLLYEATEEGHCKGLGIIPGTVTRLIGNEKEKVPHMGWNKVEYLFSQQSPYNYFVHSFAAPINKYTVAVTQHTQTFTSIVKYKNFTGMQFHPEKSGECGVALLLEFLRNS